MAEPERNDDTAVATSTRVGSSTATRPRSATFFRALVAAAVAAAAPAAGCYASEPGDDAVDAVDAADARDGDADVLLPAYGVPDASDDASAAVYSVPPYGAPEYAVPDYGEP